MDLTTTRSPSKKFLGKTWNVLGDSITAGTGTTSTYHAYLKDELGFSSVVNFGMGWSTVAKYDASDTYNSMAIRYATMGDADVITVWGGTNDAATHTPQVPIGAMADRTVDTFYGAYHVLLSGLIAKYIGKKIAVFTPMPRQSKNAMLIPYVQAVKEVSAYYSVPCLDLYANSNIYADIPAVRPILIPDGLHPNADGHRILADKIGSFLLSI